MMGKSKEIGQLPQNILSERQKQIYALYRQGLSNKEIAENLGISPRVVATQLSRIRKKAARLDFTYKMEPGAEHALMPDTESPAEQLKKKIRDDPGFFKLMFEMYASNKESVSENRYRLASAGLDPARLSTIRAKQIKVLTASGKDSGSGKIVVKMGKKNRQALSKFLHKQKIQPMQTYWDDGSAVYLVSPSDAKKMGQLLCRYPDR